jgi:hypothetical protein
MTLATKYTHDQTILETINNCRIFLQTNTIAELTDNHSRILPETTTIHDDNNSPTTHTYSISKFRWPYQQIPDTKSWKQWNKFIMSLTKPGTNYQLKTTLGAWHTDHESQRIWKFRQYGTIITHTTTSDTQWYHPTDTNRSNTTYTLQRDFTTTNVNNSIPVFPKITNEYTIEINQPRKILHHEHPIIPPKQYLAIWNQPLDVICKNEEQKNRIRILICTAIGNRLYDRTHLDCHNKSSHTRTSALAIIQSIEMIKNNQQHPNQLIKIHYQNRQINTFLEWMNDTSSPSKRMTHEYSLMATIQSLTKNYQNIEMKQTHFRKININEHPYDIISNNSNTNKDSPFIPITTVINDAILHLDNIEITTNIANTIRYANSTPQVTKFYTKKYHWNKTTFNDIDWENHGIAITNSSPNNKKFIRKMIHQWLPTLAHPSLDNIATGKLCPSCKNKQETQQHLFECDHSTMINAWNTASDELYNQLSKTPLDPTLIKLLVLSTRSWYDPTCTPSIPTFLPNGYHKLFRKQSKIGWHHISKGRLTISWQQQQQQWNPKTPERWIAYAITSIFTTIRKIWDARNGQLYNTDAEIQRTTIMMQLEPRITHLYNESNKLGAFDRKAFERPIDEILQLPTPAIQQWIHKMSNKIKHGVKRELKRLNDNNTMTTNSLPTKTRSNSRENNSINSQENNSINTNELQATNRIKEVNNETKKRSAQTNATNTIVQAIRRQSTKVNRSVQNLRNRKMRLTKKNRHITITTHKPITEERIATSTENTVVPQEHILPHPNDSTNNTQKPNPVTRNLLPSIITEKFKRRRSLRKSTSTSTCTPRHWRMRYKLFNRRLRDKSAVIFARNKR